MIPQNVTGITGITWYHMVSFCRPSADPLQTLCRQLCAKMEPKDGSTKRKRRQPNPDLVNLLRQRQTGAGWAAQFVQKHLKWLQQNACKFEESDNKLAGAVATGDAEAISKVLQSDYANFGAVDRSRAARTAPHVAPVESNTSHQGTSIPGVEGKEFQCTTYRGAVTALPEWKPTDMPKIHKL
jgi:hypothetical protein